jgi:thiamine-monophosphate kinase
MSKTLSDIGEFGLIHRIHEFLKKEGVQTPELTVGIGDDTASFRPRKGYGQLVTCDCVVEGRHYLTDFITPLDLGRRAMTMNLSDIAAMGGRPLYALVSLGLKADMPVSDVEDIYRGFIMELNPFGASIIGGNITKTAGATFIDITLIGEIEQDKLLRRSTAQIGDAILVTGYPGQAAAGLQLMRQSKPTKELRNHPLVCAFNTPSHRVKEGQAVADSMLASAMIDTSDGFLGDLGHICQESGVGALLIQEQFPLSEDLRQGASQLEMDPYELFLQESDDYELIITCSPENVAQIQSTIATVSDVPVTVVGSLTDSAGNLQMTLPDGSRRRIKPEGWDHFVK